MPVPRHITQITTRIITKEKEGKEKMVRGITLASLGFLALLALRAIIFLERSNYLILAMRYIRNFIKLL